MLMPNQNGTGEVDFSDLNGLTNYRSEFQEKPPERNYSSRWMDIMELMKSAEEMTLENPGERSQKLQLAYGEQLKSWAKSKHWNYKILLLLT